MHTSAWFNNPVNNRPSEMLNADIKIWKNSKNQLHRVEKDPVTGQTLPAYINRYGDQHWYVNGQLHRTEKHKNSKKTLPAVKNINGYREWRKHGKLHRTDTTAGRLLPAVIFSNGNTQYWVEDHQLPKSNL